MADLGCEKEPLVTELLQALEGYNALSRAIAGVVIEDPVLFDAGGERERRKEEWGRGGGGTSAAGEDSEGFKGDR